MAVNDLRNNGWLSVPWAEHLTRAGATMDGRFGYEGGNSATYSLQVRSEDVDQAMSDLCGTNRQAFRPGLDPVGDPPRIYLSRKPPARHPRFPHLLCTGISGLRQLKFRGKAARPAPPRGGGGGFGLFGGPPAGGLYTSDHDRYVLTATFAQPPWLLTLTDEELVRRFGAEPIQEWQRFTSIESTSSNESFVLEPDSFKWLEGDPRIAGGGSGVLDGPAASPDTSPAVPARASFGPRIGARVTASLQQVLYKREIILTQYRLPAHGLFSLVTGREENIIQGLCKVNDATFLGCPAGTLLFKGHKLIAKECPTFEALDAERSGRSPITYNCVFNFQYFDPPIGPDATTRGHNLAPWRYNGLWYLIGHSVTERRLLESYSFPRLFLLSG